MSLNYPDHSFAFQPIINVKSGIVISYEALVRGTNEESAASTLGLLSRPALYHFDEILRCDAILLAAKLELKCGLNLNLVPAALTTSKTAISSTMAMAAQCGFSENRITLELTENAVIDDYSSVIEAVNVYRARGVQIAIDDFGTGHSGLNQLAEFQPDSIKLDLSLIRGVESKGPRQAIIRGIIHTCIDLGIDVIAEGVETAGEYWWFVDEGVELFQGFLFAEPGFERLPQAEYPQVRG